MRDKPRNLPQCDECSFWRGSIIGWAKNSGEDEGKCERLNRNTVHYDYCTKGVYKTTQRGGDN